jgi:uncharacterized membrane protein YeaQ/YmgE (transglycosylase-associated protein family)
VTIEIPGIIAWVLIGLIAGTLASIVMGKQGGLLRNAVVGMVGSFVGGLLFLLAGLGTGDAGLLGSILVATVGAILILAIIG